MAIEIKEVTTKKELKQFIQFGIDLFKGNPYFCPPLVFDEINTFDTTKNPAHEICDHIIYMAYKDGKIVGRIVGIINYKANERWENKRLRFGWIDFIDDLEVTLFFDGTINYTILTKKIDLTKKLLEYFILSARKIHILFFNNYQLGIKLNENYLGINTII